MSAAAATRTATIGKNLFDLQMCRRELVFAGINGKAPTAGLTTLIVARKEQDFFVLPQRLFALVFAVCLLQIFHGRHEAFAVPQGSDSHFLYWSAAREASKAKPNRHYT